MLTVLTNLLKNSYVIFYVDRVCYYGVDMKLNVLDSRTDEHVVTV